MKRMAAFILFLFLVLGLLAGCSEIENASDDLNGSSKIESSDKARISKGTDATLQITEDGIYTAKEYVALYIHQYGKLPSNFITKKEAQALGWSGGSLEK